MLCYMARNLEKMNRRKLSDLSEDCEKDERGDSGVENKHADGSCPKYLKRICEDGKVRSYPVKLNKTRLEQVGVKVDLMLSRRLKDWKLLSKLPVR